MSFVNISTLRDSEYQPGFAFKDDQVIQAEAGRYNHLRSKGSFLPKSWTHRQGFFGEIQEVIRQKLGIESPRIFSKLWGQAAAAKRFEWKEGHPLTVGEFHRIEKALRDTLVFHGPGMELEGRGEDIQVHDIVEFLLGRGEPSKKWINWKNIKGILLKKDPQLLRAMREEFRVVLQSCCSYLPEVGSPEEVRFQAFVGNVVALLPYAYPEVGEGFIIPQKVDGEWRAVPYTVDKKFALSPKMFSSPMVAFGMVSKEGPPLITFLGTTFPAGEGYVATLLSDFTPGLSVGHAPYLYARKAIGEWLENKQDVRLYGTSLGGAMTMQVVRNHKERIGQVNAYNPPGLYPWNWNGYTDSPEVNIYYQEKDLVASMGFFPEGEKVNVFRVLPGETQNSLKAHARAYAGGEEVTILKSDAAYENSRPLRKLLTTLHFLLGLAFVFLPVLVAYLLYLLITSPHAALMLAKKA